MSENDDSQISFSNFLSSIQLFFARFNYVSHRTLILLKYRYLSTFKHIRIFVHTFLWIFVSCLDIVHEQCQSWSIYIWSHRYQRNSSPPFSFTWILLSRSGFLHFHDLYFLTSTLSLSPSFDHALLFHRPLFVRLERDDKKLKKKKKKKKRNERKLAFFPPSLAY